MSGETDDFADLERHRLLLEDNIKQLRKAIQHWQTWDAEYEALKEEVDSVPAGVSTKELERIKNDFDGELIDQKEIDEIFGRQKLRSKGQIVNVLDRRIDYVTKSLETLGKQLGTAENNYAAATAINQPDTTEEEGQPITEILEELDEDGNILSFKLNTPGQALPHIQEALDKAGLKDFLEEDTSTKKIAPEQESQEEKPLAQAVQPKAPTNRQPSSRPTAAPKKAVSFVDEEVLEVDEPKQGISRKAKRVEQIMKSAKEQENINKDAPVVPENEDEDEAALRQDMLSYSMGEVGAVVAELQLEEGDSDDSEFDYTDEGSDFEDEEDKYGRTKQRIVTDDYRQRMLELEKKLGIKSRFTEAAGPEHEDEGLGSGSDDERVGRIVVKQNTAAAPSASKPTPTTSSIQERQGDGKGKKGVRFADDLDIAPEVEPKATKVPEKKDLVEPLSDVVERSSRVGTSEPKATRKPSRFKKTRNETDSPDVIKGPLDAPSKFLDQQDSQSLPTGPEGTTLADKLVERDTISGPVETGDFDSSAFHEVADEHQRLRKKFIERQGGFLKEDESPIKPLDEADGGPERLSRFKAARLSQQ